MSLSQVDMCNLALSRAGGRRIPEEEKSSDAQAAPEGGRADGDVGVQGRSRARDSRPSKSCLASLGGMDIFEAWTRQALKSAVGLCAK